MGERVYYLWLNVIYIFEGKGILFESMCMEMFMEEKWCFMVE